jgi:hypothetical protein
MQLVDLFIESTSTVGPILASQESDFTFRYFVKPYHFAGGQENENQEFLPPIYPLLGAPFNLSGRAFIVRRGGSRIP